MRMASARLRRPRGHLCPAIGRKPIQSNTSPPRLQISTGYSSAILHPLTRLLDSSSDELRERALDTICAVALAVGPDFAVFVPVIKKVQGGLGGAWRWGSVPGVSAARRRCAWVPRMRSGNPQTLSSPRDCTRAASPGMGLRAGISTCMLVPSPPNNHPQAVARHRMPPHAAFLRIAGKLQQQDPPCMSDAEDWEHSSGFLAEEHLARYLNTPGRYAYEAAPVSQTSADEGLYGEIVVGKESGEGYDWGGSETPAGAHVKGPVPGSPPAPIVPHAQSWPGVARSLCLFVGRWPFLCGGCFSADHSRPLRWLAYLRPSTPPRTSGLAAPLQTCQ